MKSNLLKVLSIFFLATITFSCKKDVQTFESESSSSSTTSTTSSTWVKLTVMTSNGDKKQNYKVLMFGSEPSKTSPLPPILKEVTTDADGLAYFDLDLMITSSTPKTYYFEAFVENGSGYTWKSITHYNKSLVKGTMATSSILVE